MRWQKKVCRRWGIDEEVEELCMLDACRAAEEAASRTKAADILALGNQVLALERQLGGAQWEVAAVEAAAHAAWSAKAQHVSEHGQARF